MVTTSNIKIDSRMLKDFASPVSEDKAKKILYVNENNKIDFKEIDELVDDINEAGGLSAGTGTKCISAWEANKKYNEGHVVTYANSIFQCVVPVSIKEEFDMEDWQLLAGYSKKSYFYYNETDEINSIVLEEEVANKDSFSVNLNNLVLQSNNYILENDFKTITFNEPIPADTNVEVVVYGNMIIPTNVSNIVTKSFTATEGQTEFYLEEPVMKKEYITVNIENSVILESEWSLINGGNTVLLKNPVEEGTRVQINWFNDIKLSIGATFTPVISKEGTMTTLSWENDQDLDNPSDVVIKDGATFTPVISKEGSVATLSWTNNAELENPEPINLYDGATFTPHTTQDMHTATISFTNENGLENPEPIEIYTNYAQRIVETFTATEGQQVFVASHQIYDKSVLSVNVGNTELTASAYSLGEDGKTITLVGGLTEGDLVDIKYFYNLNIGIQGTTFIPVLTPSENGYTLSWENNGDLENPEPIEIRTNGLTVRGIWSADIPYYRNDYVTFEDDTYQYSYIALKDVPMGTDLKDTTMWFENTKTAKYIAAQMIDWGE